MKWTLTVLLAFPLAVLAQDWKKRLEVFDSIQPIEAPQGYQVLSSPGGRVIKDVTNSEPVNTKAVVESEGKRYYMSDWSWSRYQGGHDPYWILLRGEEKTEPGQPAAEAPKNPAVAPAVAAEPAKDPVAAPAGEGAKELPEAPGKEPATGSESAAPVESREPLTVEEKLERQWDGILEVFPASRDIPAPKGYKLLATPNREEKALRSTGTKTSISVQAALIRKDGFVYYISDWSWSRAKAGKEPSWMLITGAKPKSPEEVASAAAGRKDVAASTGKAPAEVAVPAVGAASLVEKVKQMTRPKVTLDLVGASGRVVALLVGNGRYSSANRTQQLLDLEDPSLNVDLLKQTLQTLNVEVRAEKDLNREQLARVIQETAAGLHPGDVFFFYYAGHALQLGGENYLVPLGINFLDRKSVRDTAYSLTGLWKAIGDRSLRFAAAYLDGCRKNPFNTKDNTFYILSRIPGLNLPADTGSKPGLLAEKPPRNTMVSFAAEPGTVMADSALGAGPSKYAAALAGAWADNVEIRAAMGQVKERVSEWTGRQQSPWVSEGDFPQFYLHTPGRSNLDPDQAVARAGEWVAREGEKGLPIAMGLLARSVRERPAKNPATASLLFLLGYQAVPVPVRSWGPFPARDGGYASEMQLSIDGRYVALYPAQGEKPDLILDREKGGTTSEVYESFAPGFGKVEIAMERLGSQGTEEAGKLPVIVFRRKAEEGKANPDAAVVQAMAPLLPKAQLIASFYDEGLERVFLALQDQDKMLTFWEYATTPPVACREDFRVVSQIPDLAKAGTGPLAAGAVPEGPQGPAHAWSLVFDSPSDQIRFLRGSEEVYRREGASKPERRLDDWRLDAPARNLALVFRDHVVVLGLDGGVVSRFDLPQAPGVARRILSFNAAFRRLALGWGSVLQPGDDSVQEIAIFDLSTGQRAGGTVPMRGYGEFAGLTSDQEWFFYYDSVRRIRLVDMVSGGARVHFPGTATLHPLPVGAGLEPKIEGEVDFPTYELKSPPLLEGLGDPSPAPGWLADLAEAVIGFRVTEKSEVEWLDDAPKLLESAAQQMRKRPGSESQKAWAQWLLVNRLGLEEDS